MLSKLCHNEMCRCAEGGCTGARKWQVAPSRFPTSTEVLQGVPKAHTQWTPRGMGLGLAASVGGGPLVRSET